MKDAAYELNSLDLDTIRLALWGADMKRYVPEVMMVCAKLGIKEPPWFEDEDTRRRVEANAELRERFANRNAKPS